MKTAIRIIISTFVAAIACTLFCIFAYAQGGSELVYTPGDADLDGEISVSDARLTLRTAINLGDIDTKGIIAADYDEDGDITVSDARNVLRTAIGLDEIKAQSIATVIEELNPTCTVDGKCVYQKDEVFTLTVPALGHNYVVSSETQPGCETKGVTVRVCTNCKDEISDEAPAKGHNFSSATCTEPEKCSACGQTRGSAKGHIKTRQSVYSAITCSACGTVLPWKKASEAEFVNEYANAVKRENVSTYLKTVCSFGPRPYYTSNFSNAADWIERMLKSIGFTSDEITREYFSIKGGSSFNIIAEIPTKRENSKVILFAAHLDSDDIGTGAIDNGSGVAALLELARVVKSKNMDLGYEIRFAFFSGEEYGFYGAYKYLNDYNRARHQYIVNIDMAGHSDAERDWYLCISTEPISGSYTYRKAYSNDTSTKFDSAKTTLGSLGEAKYYSPVTVGETDFIAFRKNGLTGVNVSWREINTSSATGSDYHLVSPRSIHTVYDTYDNFDIDSLYNTTRLLAGAFALMVR